MRRMGTVFGCDWWHFEGRIMNSIYTLETWLEIATRGLAPEAFLSVRKEITDHVQTTLERQTNAGLSQIEAEKVAVQLLGDPKKLARKFNRTYLTRKDEEALQGMQRKVIFYILYGLFHLILGLNGMKTVLWLESLRKDAFLSDLNTNYLPWIFQDLSYIMIAFSIFSACFIVINLKKVGKLRTLITIQPIFAILMIIF